jgi:tetratricopeptide (TPR) repeat protein
MSVRTALGKSADLDSHEVQLTSPIVVCTVPKSGTHLMIGILESLFGVTSVYKPPDHNDAINTQSYGDSKTNRSAIFGRRKYVTEKDILNNPNLENKFYVGHIEYSETVYTCIKDIPKILLVRDPRDYLVSMYHYLNQSPGPTHAKYKEFPTWDVKMSATILGMRDRFYSVNELFDKYFIKWIGSPKSTIIRFEDILGSEFGGEDDKVMNTFQTIITLTRLRLHFDGETLRNKIRVGSDPHKSVTFRRSKRKIGIWKEEFTEDHIKQFKLAAPSVVSVLGYEKDENWNLTSSASEYSQELNEPNLYSLLSKNRDYASIAMRYEKMMEDIVFSSPYFRELDELVNDWALRQLLELNAYSNCMKSLKRLLQINPKHPKWNYYMAFCSIRSPACTNQDFDTALNHYTIALETGFDEFWVRYMRGTLLRKLGNLESAYADLNRAVVLKPEHERAGEMLHSVEALLQSNYSQLLQSELNRIRKLVDKLEYSQAIVQLQELLQKFPNNGHLRYKEILEKLPANGIFNYLMAFCLHQLNKDLDQAVSYYNLALEYGFDEFWVRYMRGTLLRKLGDLERAYADLNRAVILKPEHESAREMLHSVEALLHSNYIKSVSKAD